MFGHAKTQDVVEKMLKTLEEIAVPIRLMLSLGMDGPNVHKSIMDKLHKSKQKKAINSLSIVHQVVLSMYVTTVFTRELCSMVSMLMVSVLTCTISLREAHAKCKAFLR